ncbi:NAD(P)-binding domain-containing protein [Rozella allomycis CSF55]|uniref:NAD(P)-binding domain-containing protein n=1 Tax=Rozella allomycis (strain CSF55) TaxID=988480 RepID=A0A075AYG6_ROZAC|nr:NAD(P)-binding domain-containing protein [Rozella allomycis CSF55]|eukprot:EPZ35149.1 NAD(P)-binding domain-containing protein [Rozella allomycis CSF55]
MDSSKVLEIVLTDEQDLFFFHSLKISEEDFYMLKEEQTLLVDFNQFPLKVTELIESVIASQFVQQDGNISHLNIIETNSFKHITHLSLKLVQGNDTAIKNYLASLTKFYKEQSKTVSSQLNMTQSSLSEQLKFTQGQNESLRKELESVKSELSNSVNQLKIFHGEEINKEREKSLRALQDVQNRLESDKKLMQERWDLQCGKLEEINQTLYTAKITLESANGEMKSKLDFLTSENSHFKTEVEKLRISNKELDLCKFEQEKEINQLKIKIAALQQQIDDKKEVFDKTQQLYDQSLLQKKSLEENISRQREQIKLYEENIKVAHDEIRKANEIIQKLQTECRNSKAKSKAKSTSIQQNEKLLEEKEKTIKKLEESISTFKNTIEEKETIISKKENEIENLLKKLEENKNIIGTNEHVIEWLHKQLNDESLKSKQIPFQKYSSVQPNASPQRTILAYGQTGSGKTFSMTGTTENYKHRGIIPRAISHLFRIIQERTDIAVVTRVSYIEIYNEVMSDLLSTLDDSTTDGNLLGSTMVKGLNMKIATSEEEALNYLFEGETNRSIAEHQLNRGSSRSHCIFTIYIEARSRVESSEKVVYSKLNMVDLAGSERLSKTQSEGQTLKEAMDHVPYRQSKLTHVLRDSLGGNCEKAHLEETISTLRFATRMMNVTTSPIENIQDDPTVKLYNVFKKALIKKYERIIKELKQELLMHDAMANRSHIQYEPFNDLQRAELQRTLQLYLKGEEEEIEIVSMRQIKEMLSLFKSMYKSLELEIEEKIKQKGQDKNEERTENENTVGDLDGLGFGVGIAPSGSKPSSSIPPKGKKEGGKKKGKPQSALTEDIFEEPIKESPPTVSSAKPEPPIQINQVNVAKEFSGDQIQMSPVSAPNHAKTKAEEFENFKLRQGAELFKALNENKQKKQLVKGLADQVNNFKFNIDEITKRLEPFKDQITSLDPLDENQENKLMKEKSHYDLLCQLKEAKNNYKIAYDKWKTTKTDVDYCEKLVLQCRERFLAEFEQWYSDYFDDRPITATVQEDVMDVGEQFEKLHLDKVSKEDPNSVPFYNALRRQERKIIKGIKKNSNLIPKSIFLLSLTGIKVFKPFKTYSPNAKNYVLITGCSSGIGYDAAIHFAEKGYKVFAGVRKQEDANMLSTKHQNLVPLIIDVAKDQSVEKAFDHVQGILSKESGVLVAVVNNAGIALTSPAEMITPEQLKKCMEVNVFGVMRVTSVFLPLLRKSQGRVIIISSCVGFITPVFMTGYSMTKFAIESYADGLRAELRPFDISVSLVEPGMIKSRFVTKASNEFSEIYKNPRVTDYEKSLKKWEKVSFENEKIAIPASFTSDAILHAVSSCFPKTRYLVGADAYFLSAFKAFPDRVKDLMILPFQ